MLKKLSKRIKVCIYKSGYCVWQQVRDSREHISISFVFINVSIYLSWIYVTSHNLNRIIQQWMRCKVFHFIEFVVSFVNQICAYCSIKWQNCSCENFISVALFTVYWNAEYFVTKTRICLHKKIKTGEKLT